MRADEMSSRWFYSRDNFTFGPFTPDEIRDFASRKLLRDTDWLWQEGTDRANAVQAGAALDFAGLTPTVAPIPDWLADLAATQARGPVPGPENMDAPPEWMEDLRLWVALELAAEAAARREKVSEDTGRTGALPDWVRSWLTPETPEPPPPRAPIATAPVVPVLPSPPVRMPVPLAPPTPPVVIQPVAEPTPSQPPAAPTRVPPTPVPPSPIAKVLDDSGIDMETGRVNDLEKFRRWKQRHVATAPASAKNPTVSNASLMEVFRDSRLAVERWVDDESNRARIMDANPHDLQHVPEVQAILAAYAGYGSELRTKLLHHLQFMADNRRKYYSAVEAQRRNLP